MASNLHFNSLNQHFHEKIYRSFKGRLRLTILNRDFDALNLYSSPLSILDIGGGSGVFSLSLSQKGHDITLLEPSEMIHNAKEAFKIAEQKAHFIHDFAENIDQYSLPEFDLILLHAVLEWVENPLILLDIILPYLKPNGKLSLLFYNRNGLIFHNLIRGNFYFIKRKKLTRYKGSLTPTNPIDPLLIEDFFKEKEYSLLKQSGIRVFHDYMTKTNQEKIVEDERIKMELIYSENKAFMHTARYFHWVYEKN